MDFFNLKKYLVKTDVHENQTPTSERIYTPYCIIEQIVFQFMMCDTNVKFRYFEKATRICLIFQLWFDATD